MASPEEIVNDLEKNDGMSFLPYAYQYISHIFTSVWCFFGEMKGVIKNADLSLSIKRRLSYSLAFITITLSPLLDLLWPMISLCRSCSTSPIAWETGPLRWPWRIHMISFKSFYYLQQDLVIHVDIQPQNNFHWVSWESEAYQVQPCSPTWARRNRDAWDFRNIQLQSPEV